MQYVLYLIILASILTLPWWITVPLMVIGLTQEYGGPFVVSGAVLMDALYGTHVDSLGGFSLIYTTIFAFAAFLSIYMRQKMLD